MFSRISTPAPEAVMKLAKDLQVKRGSGNLTETQEFTESEGETVAREHLTRKEERESRRAQPTEYPTSTLAEPCARSFSYHR